MATIINGTTGIDKIQDDAERLQAVKKEIVNYLETPIQEIHEKFFLPRVQEKIQHNKNLIVKMAKKDPFNVNAWNFKRKQSV